MKYPRIKLFALLVCFIPLFINDTIGLPEALRGLIDFIARTSETRYASGSSAYKSLDVVCKEVWKQNLFPSSCVLKINSKETNSDIRNYWFRVYFKPDCATKIIANIYGDVSRDDFHPVSFSSHKSLLDPNGPSLPKPPSFFRPADLGPTATTIQMLQGSGSTSDIIRSIYFVISKRKGIAYIRVWGL